MSTLIVLVVLGLTIGVLLGSTWTEQAVQSTFRHRAAERRWLNHQWWLIDDLRRQSTECPRCAAYLPVVDYRYAPQVAPSPNDDD